MRLPNQRSRRLQHSLVNPIWQQSHLLLPSQLVMAGRSLPLQLLLALCSPLQVCVTSYSAAGNQPNASKSLLCDLCKGTPFYESGLVRAWSLI